MTKKELQATLDLHLRILYPTSISTLPNSHAKLLENILYKKLQRQMLKDYSRLHPNAGVIHHKEFTKKFMKFLSTWRQTQPIK